MEQQEQKANAIQSASAQQTSGKKFWNFVNDSAEVIETILVSVFVVILLFAYVIRPVTVEGRSMESTLQSGDRLLMTDLLYKPDRGDIVIVDNTYAYTFDENGNIQQGDGIKAEKRLIKRIIAKGGDTLDIDFETGEVTLNGEILNESYINNLTTVEEYGFEFPITIPEGYYFVMGDNRQNSTDSRSRCVGLVPEDAILGKAIFCLTPNFGGIYDNYEDPTGE